MENDETIWDCVVVGGGAAGLSAALVLGRARRRTLVVDAGEQSNLPAHGIGGLLGHDGRPPAELYAAGREELAAYPGVELRAGEVVDGERGEDGFVLDLADGTQVTTRRVLLATGMTYDHPRLEGMAERWGGSVFHCPFCHGWEVRDQVLAVLDADTTGVQRALLLRMWSDDVTLLTDGPAAFGSEDRARLAQAGIAVDERHVSGVRGDGDALTAIAFADGGERACGGLLVAVRLRQRSKLAERLGAAAAEPNPLMADALRIDASFATTVPGVYAAGDVGGTMPSVANSVSAGSTAAAMIVHTLALESEPAAVAVPTAPAG